MEIARGGCQAWKGLLLGLSVLDRVSLERTFAGKFEFGRGSYLTNDSPIYCEKDCPQSLHAELRRLLAATRTSRGPYLNRGGSFCEYRFELKSIPVRISVFWITRDAGWSSKRYATTGA